MLLWIVLELWSWLCRIKHAYGLAFSFSSSCSCYCLPALPSLPFNLPFTTYFSITFFLFLLFYLFLLIVSLVLFLLYFPSYFSYCSYISLSFIFPLFLVIFFPPFAQLFYSSCCFISSFDFYFPFLRFFLFVRFLLVTWDWNAWLLGVKKKKWRMPYPSQFCSQSLRGVRFGYPCGV
jgi:hypothetical protein